MCPIVPTFTCGFFRSYFAFAMRPTSRWRSRLRDSRWSPCPGLNRRPRPYQGRALPTELHGRSDKVWSGKRDSNPRPPAWKAGALPLSYASTDKTSLYASGSDKSSGLAPQSPLPGDFVAERGASRADIQGAHLAGHRNRQENVAGACYQRSEPLTLATEDQAERASEVHRPERRTLADCATVDPNT